MQQLWSCAEIDTFVLLWPNCSMFMCGICCNCQKYLNYTCILRMRQAHWLKLAKTWLGLHSECGWLLSRNPLHFILTFKGLICESWIPIWKLLWTPLITWTFELLSKLFKFLRIWHQWTLDDWYLWIEDSTNNLLMMGYIKKMIS